MLVFSRDFENLAPISWIEGLKVWILALILPLLGSPHSEAYCNGRALMFAEKLGVLVEACGPPDRLNIIYLLSTRVLVQRDWPRFACITRDWDRSPRQGSS